jgi:hypothetical protein
VRPPRRARFDEAAAVKKGRDDRAALTAPLGKAQCPEISEEEEPAGFDGGGLDLNTERNDPEMADESGLQASDERPVTAR